MHTDLDQSFQWAALGKLVSNSHQMKMPAKQKEKAATEIEKGGRP